jgi:hypothetical protein
MLYHTTSTRYQELAGLKDHIAAVHHPFAPIFASRRTDVPKRTDCVPIDKDAMWMATGADINGHTVFGSFHDPEWKDMCLLAYERLVTPSWGKLKTEILVIHQTLCKNITFRDDYAHERYCFFSTKGRALFAEAGLDPNTIRQLQPIPESVAAYTPGACHDNVRRHVAGNTGRGMKHQFGYSFHAKQCGCCMATEAHSYVRTSNGGPFDFYSEIPPDNDPMEPPKVVIDDPILTADDCLIIDLAGRVGAYAELGHAAEKYGRRAGGGISFAPPRRLTCWRDMPTTLPAGWAEPWEWTRRAALAAKAAGALEIKPKTPTEIKAMTVALKKAGLGACARCSRMDVAVTVTGVRHCQDCARAA